jgi:hypothetical protein
MKTFLLWLVALVILMGIGAAVFYKYYLPEMVAEVLTEEETPSYVPPFVRSKVVKYKEPINRGARDVIDQIHQSGVTIDQVINTIDNTSEADINALISELNEVELQSTDQAFNIASKHLAGDFDVEVLRKPFKENVDLKNLQKGIRYANDHRNDEEMDIDMAKEVIKKVLIQKEKEYQQNSN